MALFPHFFSDIRMKYVKFYGDIFLFYHSQSDLSEQSTMEVSCYIKYSNLERPNNFQGYQFQYLKAVFRKYSMTDFSPHFLELAVINTDQ